ncbi:Lipocalin-like domain-containing protein [Tricladium varicosporioides]|nr:Lipocalin-like domain-containing protein [Hymenoscyphus varicosporioides]
MTSTPTTERDQILGAWKLLTFDLIIDDASGSQKTVQPMGPTPLGRALFSPEGYVSITGTDPARTTSYNLAVPWVMAEDKDIAFIARAMMSYWGSFRVFSEDGDLRVATQVHISLDPSWIGTEQVRRASLGEENGKKILVLKPVQSIRLPDGTKGLAVLTWEKLITTEVAKL